MKTSGSRAKGSLKVMRSANGRSGSRIELSELFHRRKVMCDCLERRRQLESTQEEQWGGDLLEDRERGRRKIQTRTRKQSWKNRDGQWGFWLGDSWRAKMQVSTWSYWRLSGHTRVGRLGTRRWRSVNEWMNDLGIGMGWAQFDTLDLVNGKMGVWLGDKTAWPLPPWI